MPHVDVIASIRKIDTDEDGRNDAVDVMINRKMA
jgi:hypothetical protein